ncbi:MAG: hypothetical protein ACUVQP_08655 [Bacteroidales bacterium]
MCKNYLPDITSMVKREEKKGDRRLSIIILKGFIASLLFLILPFKSLRSQEVSFTIRYIESKVPLKSTRANGDSVTWHLDIKSDINGDGQIETISVGWSHGSWVITADILDTIVGEKIEQSLGRLCELYENNPVYQTTTEICPVELAVGDITSDGVNDVIAVFRNADSSFVSWGGYFTVVSTYNKVKQEFEAFPFSSDWGMEIPKKGVIKFINGGNQIFEEFYVWNGERFVLYYRKE